MLQDDQVKKTQMRLMQAGIRTKDLAFFIIFARFVLPVVIGIAAVRDALRASTISPTGRGSAAT